MERQRESSGRAGTSTHKVVVVGGGVSGCACAARLAVQNVEVTVISSALDVVGLPGYGPILAGEGDGWGKIAATLALLPEGLRRAWMNSAAVPESGVPVLLVDRRSVSIEAKRALEELPGLRLRQGLIVDVRAAAPREGDGGALPIEVETAFSEVFQGHAVVLAPGLALRGRLEVGEDVLPGGRYGEVPADQLCDALERLGARLAEVALEVGSHYSCESDFVRSLLRAGSVGAGGADPPEQAVPVPVALRINRNALDCATPEMREAFRALREAVGADASAAEERVGALLESWDWPMGYPPTPHQEATLRSEAMALFRPESPVTEPATSDWVMAVPDGMATREYYVSPDAVAWVKGLPTLGAGGVDSEADQENGEVVPGHARKEATRLGYRVSACAVDNSGPGGRVSLPGLSADSDRVRVIGRAAGANGYLESLQSGLAAADDLVRYLNAWRQ